MTTVSQITDGRRKRTARSRKAMIDAALALIHEGHFVQIPAYPDLLKKYKVYSEIQILLE